MSLNKYPILKEIIKRPLKRAPDVPTPGFKPSPAYHKYHELLVPYAGDAKTVGGQLISVTDHLDHEYLYNGNANILADRDSIKEHRQRINFLKKIFARGISLLEVPGKSQSLCVRQA